MFRPFGTARLITHYTVREQYLKRLAERQHKEIPLWRRAWDHINKRDKRYFALLLFVSLSGEWGWYRRFPKWIKKRRNESRQKKKLKYRAQFLGQDLQVDKASTHFTSPQLQEQTRKELFRIFMAWEQKSQKGLSRYLLIMALKKMGEEYSTVREDAFLMRSSYTQMANKMRGGLKYREYIDEVTRALKMNSLSQADFVSKFEDVLTQQYKNLEEEVQKKTKIVSKNQDQRVIRVLNMEATPLNFSYE